MLAGRTVAYFCDGTWNDPDTDTNVCKLYMACTADQKQYDRGVGGGRDITEERRGSLSSDVGRFESTLGSLPGCRVGNEVSKNIVEAWAWLSRWVTDKHDQVYIFGFSRGSYTARSLAGLIGAVGLVDGTKQDYDSLKAKGDEAMQKVYHHPPSEERDLARKQFHREHEVDDWRQSFVIHFVGVFDTVGALGIPKIDIFGLKQVVDKLQDIRYGFHDVSIGPHVRNAVHAVALDEIRKVMRPTMWKNSPEDGQTVRQVWFAGAHADVGGGWSDAPELSLLPLHWMLEMAAHFGLSFEAQFRKATQDDALAIGVNGDMHIQRTASRIPCFKGWLSTNGSCSDTVRVDKICLDGAGTGLTQALHWSVLVRTAIDGTYVPKALHQSLESGDPAPERLWIVRLGAEAGLAQLSTVSTKIIWSCMSKKAVAGKWTDDVQKEFTQLLKNESLWVEVGPIAYPKQMRRHSKFLPGCCRRKRRDQDCPDKLPTVESTHATSDIQLP